MLTTARLALGSWFLLLAAARLGAQGGRGAVAGRVLDQASGRGVPRAAVLLLPSGPRAITDSAGRFLMRDLPVGYQRFVAQAPGFPMTQLIVELRPGERTEATITLDSTRATAQALAPVKVEAEAEEAASYRLVDFERRRRTGRGQYLDADEIVRSGANNLAELTRNMRGVTLHCGGPDGCRIQMVRAHRNCPPEYVVDGRVDNMFGMTTPIRDIVALEVYTGPSDVPGEFAGRNAGCGVVVIWTRSGPDRDRG